MSKNQKTLAILVGGGPAPGINGIISSATIEAIENDCKVVGIIDGYKWLARGEKSKVIELEVKDVSRIHFNGGSILRTSRENPTKDPEKMANIVKAFHELEIDYLLTIGGDDTLYTASELAKLIDRELKIVHVPKTIDNDLPLPNRLSTFGFQTARHIGVNIVRNIMEDSKTTGRWYFLITMGRKAGHLTIGICKAAGATLAIIPEEFESEKISLSSVCDIIEGSIIKRISMDKDYGVVVLAEGLALKFDESELKDLKDVELDEHGNVRLSEVDLGKILKNEVKRRLKERGINITIIDKDIGYELRCAPPIPFDKEYTRDLGYVLINGLTGAMVTLVGGKIEPLYFKDAIDPMTGKTKIRLVDVETESYEVAREYMIRLRKRDFEEKKVLAGLAKAANVSEEDFTEQFKHLAK